MNEVASSGHEKTPKQEDAARLAGLLYWALDREHKIDEVEIGEIVSSIKEYIDFRAAQDPEMGQAVLEALESFVDPDPTLATLEAAQDMQERANRVRGTLGLVALDLPTELPSPGDEQVPPQ